MSQIRRQISWPVGWVVCFSVVPEATRRQTRPLHYPSSQPRPKASASLFLSPSSSSQPLPPLHFHNLQPLARQPSKMVTCSCGQKFASNLALRQHQTASSQCAPTTTARASRPPRPARGPNESWLWKQVVKTTVVSRIEFAATEP